MRMTVLAIVCLLVSTSCGGGQKPAAAHEQEEAVVGPPQVAWDDMNHEQRERYMKKVVMPAMKEMFVAFDPKHFDDVTCKTCHGDGAADGKFAMPNAGLPKLPSTEADFMKLMETDAAVMEFMMTKVKPRMAELLGEREYDPAQPELGGFGCHECHTFVQ